VAAGDKVAILIIGAKKRTQRAQEDEALALLFGDDAL
jgi:hypothetical protein